MNQGAFGRYREIALLGQGGMARVVLAALPGAAGTQKLLVVKEMLPELAADPEFVAMFTDEARLACRLDHPNLIQTFELAEVNGRYFFVMEYLEGQPLSAVLGRTRRQVPLPLYLRVLTRVLAGLHYAHELTDLEGRPLGVVHRDVTPQNIFLCYGGAIKLVDFGIAKAAGAAVRTKAGTFKGKVAYASKEQLANEPIDRRADVFAAGVLLWEGIVGQRIAKDMDEAAILQRRFLGAERYAADVNPQAPRELADIAKKAMSPERDDRYETAAQMQAALEAYIEAASMRVVDEDVGGFIVGLFAEQRSQVRKLVQERLANPATDTATPSLLLPPPASSSQNVLAADSEPGATARLALRPSSAVAAELPTDVTVSLHTSPRTTRRSPFAAVAILGALVVVGAVVVTQRRSASRDPASASSAALLIAPAASDTASANVTRTVDVTLTASPASAHFWLDGRALEGNPFKGTLPRDGASHKLEVRAPGFVSEERTVTLDGAVQVELALKPDAKPLPASKPARVDDGPSLRPTAPRTAKPIDTNDPYGGSR